MTRINAGVDPSELCDKHLVAEWKELPRIRHLAARYDMRPIPENFTLGKGHMRFFIDKGKYLADRHRAIMHEMLRRGYKPKVSRLLTAAVWPVSLFNNWTASDDDRLLIQRRIADRLPQKARWTKPAHRPNWLGVCYAEESHPHS